MSIFPYIYSMVEDFGITEDKNQISMYAGMIISAFVFAEFMTGFIWGRLSDKLGRKPIMMSGLVGTGISSLIFGFSRSLPMAMFARALGGILNGYGAARETCVCDKARTGFLTAGTCRAATSVCCRPPWRSLFRSRNISVRDTHPHRGQVPSRWDLAVRFEADGDA